MQLQREAVQLDKKAKRWKNNRITTSASRTANLMLEMISALRSVIGCLSWSSIMMYWYSYSADTVQESSRKDFIDKAHLIIQESETITNTARKVAKECTNKTLKMVLPYLLRNAMITWIKIPVGSNSVTGQNRNTYHPTEVFCKLRGFKAKQWWDKLITTADIFEWPKPFIQWYSIYYA